MTLDERQLLTYLDDGKEVSEMTIERVSLTLTIDTGSSAVTGSPITALAEIIEREVVTRLRSGADYGNIRTTSGETVGSWNIWLDGDHET